MKCASCTISQEQHDPYCFPAGPQNANPPPLWTSLRLAPYLPAAHACPRRTGQTDGRSGWRAESTYPSGPWGLGAWQILLRSQCLNSSNYLLGSSPPGTFPKANSPCESSRSSLWPVTPPYDSRDQGETQAMVRGAGLNLVDPQKAPNQLEKPSNACKARVKSNGSGADHCSAHPPKLVDTNPQANGVHQGGP